MKPLSVSIYRYSLPFIRPVPVGSRSIATREGLVLCLQHGPFRGYGETAPLPGLHEECLDDAFGELGAVLRHADLQTGSLSALTVSEQLPDNLLPSVRTGIEMALLNLQAAWTGSFIPLPGIPAPADRLPLNALLFGDTPTVLQQAAALYRRGYRTFKLKVQARNADTALQQIRELDRSFGNDVLLRLDSNRSFDRNEAREFLSSLPADRIAYIEEPLSDPSGIPELVRRTAIRCALDETLWQAPHVRHELPDSCLGAYILKPARTGGISATTRLALEASSRGSAAVISSVYESGISIGFYARLASLLSRTPTACGIDTFRQFRQDLPLTPITSESGALDVETVWQRSRTPDESRLKQLSAWTL
ncbi:o-succinylbenzoate synthase [Prosthecochloris sp. ZM_2]|uniref:o-succinylbenzoate synthase n=1 Tax=Prosthecochloris sp. ZM_2 TaxID=2045206 RepID=UPI000DF80A09|nr:o-succinylbenzoate synthase [Prosthecochloris sp. ZM_2]RNA65410.1 o-succinylbenzoate synthase [Prosthecochloris sp. ZM_2]